MGTTNFDTVAAAFAGNLTGNVTGNVTGNLTGQVTAFPVTARTATAAPGGTTGVIADAGGLQVIAVTCDDANKVITLPTPTPGVVVILINGATGYELRSSAPATIAINGGAGANAESAIGASTVVVAVCTSATTWLAFSVALSSVETAA